MRELTKKDIDGLKSQLSKREEQSMLRRQYKKLKFQRVFTLFGGGKDE